MKTISVVAARATNFATVSTCCRPRLPASLEDADWLARSKYLDPIRAFGKDDRDGPSR